MTRSMGALTLFTVLATLAQTVLVHGAVPIRGVNLGGWLLSEKWMLPTLYAQANNDSVLDEWTFGYVPNAKEILTQHWENFITEQDFIDIANAGLNFVRIPIGYWAFGTHNGEPYVVANQTAYLARAVNWASKYGIQVAVDLHGVPGSQNGLQASGHLGPIDWQTSAQHAEQAQDCINTIASTFESHTSTVTHIELINEPVLDRTWINNLESYTKEYYTRTYPGVAQKGFQGMLHDGFLPLSSWNNFLPGSVLDTHIYEGLYPYHGVDAGTTLPSYSNISDEALRGLCQLKGTLASSSKHHTTIVAEWTVAQPQESAASRKRSTKFNYRDSRKPSAPQPERRVGDNQIAYRKQLFDTQRAIYEENAAGWAMWTWKMNYDGPWSYRSGLKHGWITRDLDSRGATAAC